MPLHGMHARNHSEHRSGWRDVEFGSRACAGIRIQCEQAFKMNSVVNHAHPLRIHVIAADCNVAKGAGNTNAAVALLSGEPVQSLQHALRTLKIVDMYDRMSACPSCHGSSDQRGLEACGVNESAAVPLHQ